MGRQGAVVSTPPPAAVQSPPAMPPMPPKPPKKRYLMENPPLPGGLLQLAEVSAQQHRPPPVAELAGYHVPRVGGPGGLNGTRYVPCDDAEPLNLSTAPTTEVRLSRIVDHVVEEMLKKSQADAGRQGDPLRLWFTNQFETRQRNECSSSGSSPSPRQKSVSPQLPSPAAASGASPGRPSPPAEPDAAAAAGVVELTIGMANTINRVIDNVFRQDLAGKRCEVTSCSSDCVNSTTPPEPAPAPAPPPPPPARRRPASTTAVSAERRAERSHRAKRSQPAAAAAATAAAAQAPSKRSRTGSVPSDRLPATVSDDDDGSRSGLVIDESRGVGSDAAADAPDSRTDRSPPVEPGSPRRRSRKRNAPADSRTADSKSQDLAASPSKGSRKRKVGKEDIVRIQKDEDSGLDSTVPPVPSKEKSKSQPK